MEQVVEGFFNNGKFILNEDVKIKSSKIRVIFYDDEKEDTDNLDELLLRNKLSIKTKGFKFNREEIHER